MGLRNDGAALAARHAAGVTGAAALAGLILLIPLALSDGVDDFLKSYFVELSLLIEDWHNPLPGLIGNAPIFLALLEAYAAMFVLAVVSIALSARRVGARPTIAPVVMWTLALGLALLAVTFVAITLPGKVHYHYLLLAVPALVTLGGVGHRSSGALRRSAERAHQMGNPRRRASDYPTRSAC